MRTEYDYMVDTTRTSEVPFRISTKNAEILFFPSSDANNEIRAARVSVEGSSSSGNQEVARAELIKVLVIHFGPQASASIHPTGWTEVREEGENKSIKIGAGLTISSRVRYVAPIDPLVKALKVNIDGDANILLQYYEATKKKDPQDRYLQMFRVIEYLCGKKPIGRRMVKHIMMGLGDLWDIPPSTVQRVKSIGKWTATGAKRDLAMELYDVRGRCSHFSPIYGFRPLDVNSEKTVQEALPIIEEVTRHSLEMNELTRER